MKFVLGMLKFRLEKWNNLRDITTIALFNSCFKKRSKFCDSNMGKKYS